MSTIGERIKFVRKEEGLTQKDFSSHLLISQSYLSGLEKGNENPSEKLIKLISLEFGIEYNWLTTGEGKMYSDIFEYNYEDSAEISNKALLQIMEIINHKSNTIYWHTSTILMSFSKIMKYYVERSDVSVDAFELFGNFIISFEQLTKQILAVGNQNIKIENYVQQCESDLKLAIEYLKNIKI